MAGEPEHACAYRCSSAPANYNQLSHELRIDHGSPDLRALTTVSAARLRSVVFGNTRAGRGFVVDVSYDFFLGASVAAWHRTAGVVQPLVDLWDVADPASAAWRPVEDTWTFVDGVECSGGESREADCLTVLRRQRRQAFPAGTALVNLSFELLEEGVLIVNR